ncbi:hypothetical protein LTS18_001155 [Coniosporium uncinatum]|uniref:Uncharacterized protein n=1 Tax=Coniosporium uncinatum TaxID=93489 RepID=A0ACC3DUY9_9PEZI|nr:hypothetical protein LTS18_001155 [Coniosporium uncinatum]
MATPHHKNVLPSDVRPNDIFDSILAPMLPTGDSTAWREIKRLRSFLHRCTRKDYGLTVCSDNEEVNLSEVYANHYIALYGKIKALRERRDSMSESEAAGLAATLWTQLHSPAQHLGIPINVVRLILQRFYQYARLGPPTTYEGCCEQLRAGYDLYAFAEKVVIDHKIVFPALFIVKGMRTRHNHAKFKALQEKYFKKLDADVVVEPSPHGQRCDVRIRALRLTDVTREFYATHPDERVDRLLLQETRGKGFFKRMGGAARHSRGAATASLSGEVQGSLPVHTEVERKEALPAYEEFDRSAS